MAIEYAVVESLDLETFLTVLRNSGLAERRPVADQSRIGRMLENANLIVVARDGDNVVGVARSITDFSYCCYLSDLAVDRSHQGRGIGKRLIEETRKAAGPEAMCLLLSSPDAMAFYKAIGMPQPENAFLYKRER
ncbi:GCN5-related N-acetyltransferase [Methylocella tundrae]|uniref:GCN5-related N-acetyltransferase n=1 Tax=Methylocella tundrae TaxID=227605 RepID=A0A8B6M549_METTU|nr:GNAT family N-acetyltransferase [Methylocella tundrae]VTZ28246.1 GCN5-related N-acetyltransferase [Methylocella tundrae]VTZ49955.1 GCN5-related N-acetyltransferase [Methylocella tundrae]